MSSAILKNTPPFYPVAAALLFCAAWLLPFPAQAQDDQAVILQYHHISTESPPVTSISPADFRQHMEYLKDNDFNILPLEEVIHALNNDEPLPDKSAVITFDDGYTSVYEEAYPVLREYDWPFTIFVPAGLISSESRLYSSWDELREMGDNGATLANHTMTHPYFLERAESESRSQWLARIEEEIVEAEKRIEEETGQNHRMLAYPYGEYNPDIQALVEELGFIGIAQQSGPVNTTSDFTSLPRFPFSGIYVGMNTYTVKVNSLAFNLDTVRPESPVTSDPSPSAFISFLPGDYRLENFSCYNNNEVMQVTREDGGFRISTEVENRSRRFRYNCTAPGPDGRFYWYSVDWVNPDIPE